MLLATICVGILAFAEVISTHNTLPMYAHIDQISASNGNLTTVRLSLTDTEGEPIDQASISSRVYMLTMQMGPQQIAIKGMGQGIYLAQIRFSMPGAWEVDFVARAAGFDENQQSIQLTVS
jgi:nitrogen fixation protein FixH